MNYESISHFFFVQDLCFNGGKCQSEGEKKVCSCPGQYTGQFCQTGWCDLSPSVCQNSGKCLTDQQGWHCNCTGKSLSPQSSVLSNEYPSPGAWTGPRCSVSRLHCVPGDRGGPCGRHGECRHDKFSNTLHCACHLWWKGDVRV